MSIHSALSEQEFHHDGFWKKIACYAVKAGREVIEKALTLYYIASDGDTPVWARTTVYTALAYFISPLDAVPDALPGVGFGDDLSVLGVAFAAVAAHVKDEHVQRARQQIERWFG